MIKPFPDANLRCRFTRLVEVDAPPAVNPTDAAALMHRRSERRCAVIPELRATRRHCGLDGADRTSPTADEPSSDHVTRWMMSWTRRTESRPITDSATAEKCQRHLWSTAKKRRMVNTSHVIATTPI